MPLVEVRHLVKQFGPGGGLFSRGPAVRAVDDVSFAIEAGETFGLVGESGSGKTTTGRCMLRLIEPTSGEVRFRGEDVLKLPPAPAAGAAPHADGVSGSLSSLNPRMRIRRHRPGAPHHPPARSRAERRDRVDELLRLVGLEPAQLPTVPARVQRRPAPAHRRGAGARPAPSFIIADEPVSALDVSIQAQIINLLLDLQEQLNADVPVHRARPAAGAPHLFANGRDVSRQDRRIRQHRQHLRQPAASLHAGALVRDPGNRSRREPPASGPGSGAGRSRGAVAGSR
jgi:oligopeptide transport system ATP-binding protein